jgi:putative ABC transport system permease protein
VSEYSGGRFGSVSVAFQFVLASALVFSAAVMSAQLQYFRGAPLGYNQNNLIALPVQSASEKIEAVQELKNAALKLPGVLAASQSNTVPDRLVYLGVYRLPGWDENRTVLLTVPSVDPDFLDTYEMELLAGNQAPVESDFGYLLSDLAAREFGWERPEDAVGQTIETTFNDTTRTKVISGVFGEYHHFSLNRRITPRLIVVSPGVYPNYLTLRLDPGYGDQALASIEGEWQKYLPGEAFIPFVLKDQITGAYDDMHRITRQFFILAAVVLTVACVGLLGLAGYKMEERGSEIRRWRLQERGPVWIVSHLSGRFGYLLVLAAVAGAAIAYLAAMRWLDYFAYHITLDPALFLTAGIAIILLGILVVIIPAAVRVIRERRSAMRLITAPARR